MCPIFTGVESRVTKISYSHSYIRFFIHRTGTFPFNLQRCQNYLKFGAIPWGFNFLFCPSYLSLKAAESENFAWVGFAYFFFLSGWCCNQEVVTRSYTFYSTFVSFSLILENEEINVTEKKKISLRQMKSQKNFTTNTWCLAKLEANGERILHWQKWDKFHNRDCCHACL